MGSRCLGTSGIGAPGVLRRSGGRGRTSCVTTVQSQVETFTLPVSMGGIFGLLFQSNVSELWTVFPSSQRILLGGGRGLEEQQCQTEGKWTRFGGSLCIREDSPRRIVTITPELGPVVLVP